MPKNKNPAARRFWAYEEAAEDAPARLRLEGVIAEETWWGDEVTPDMFRQELEAHPGDIEVIINSPGGDVIAASQIYAMLVEHRGRVTVKVVGIAASAASVVAMAGETVLMAPTAYMMVHDAWSIAFGNKHAMRHEADVLEEIDAGIRDAYRLKTGLDDQKLTELMEDESWLSARSCIELGFADGYIGVKPQAPEEQEDPEEPEEPDDHRAAALMAQRGLRVAYSPRRHLDALRQKLRFEEVLASANHDSLDALLRGHADETPKDGPTDDEAPQSNPADDAGGAARRRLRLLSA